MSKSDEFKIKELCWAKIKGFPWWPALIRETNYINNQKYYNIGYICESLGSDLDSSCLKKWKENYNLFKQGWTNPKDKKSLKQNDFDCSLAMADKLAEGKISPEDHDKFLLKYKTKKERHSLYNVHEFIKEIEEKRDNKNKKGRKEEKKEEEKDNKIIKEKNEEKKEEEKTEKKKLIGRKRKEKFIELVDDENKSENSKEKKEEKDEEEKFEMNIKDLNKTDNLVKNITNNLDEIIAKTEKYQKFFEKECKDKNISYLDDKNIKTKIELVKYIQIMNDVFDMPIKMEKELSDNNNLEEKEKKIEMEKVKEI